MKRADPLELADSRNLHALARAAVAGYEGNLHLDTLERLKTELSVLQTALRNDNMPMNRHEAADFLCHIITRIELATALAEPVPCDAQGGQR